MGKSTAAAVGVVAVVVIGLGVIGFGLGFKTNVAFNLKRDAAGICQPSEPEQITAGWQHKVTWAVNNVDCDPQYVALKNFKHPIGGGLYDPPEDVVKDDPVVGGPVATGGSLTVDTKVIKFRVWPKLFKYEIWLGATAGGVVLRRDPDIDIWP